MISVLIPSRGRVRALTASVRTLRRRAADASSTEILVAADPDDPATIDAAGELGAGVHVAPQRFGYPGLHHYYNYLAAQASGDWLFVWNDDARMLTPGWDEIIRREPPGFLHPDTDYAPETNTFPVLPREWARLLGHLSPVHWVDLWLQEVGRMTATTRRVPVRIRHARATGDATAADRDSRDVTAELDVFNSLAALCARFADAQKLQQFLGRPPLDPETADIRAVSLEDVP